MYKPLIKGKLLPLSKDKGNIRVNTIHTNKVLPKIKPVLINKNSGSPIIRNGMNIKQSPGGLVKLPKLGKFPPEENSNSILVKKEKFSDLSLNNPFEKDSLFLTNNYVGLNIFPRNEERDDLLSSIRKIERMLKTPPRADRKNKLFGKIYKQDEEFTKDLKKRKKEKGNYSLINYQNNLMTLVSSRMCNDNLRELSINLKKIREKSETVQPIKINWEEYNKLMTNIGKLKMKSKLYILIYISFPIQYRLQNIKERTIQE